MYADGIHFTSGNGFNTKNSKIKRHKAHKVKNTKRNALAFLRNIVFRLAENDISIAIPFLSLALTNLQWIWMI
jgi:hypothetical protein